MKFVCIFLLNQAPLRGLLYYTNVKTVPVWLAAQRTVYNQSQLWIRTLPITPLPPVCSIVYVPEAITLATVVHFVILFLGHFLLLVSLFTQASKNHSLNETPHLLLTFFQQSTYQRFL